MNFIAALGLLTAAALPVRAASDSCNQLLPWPPNTTYSQCDAGPVAANARSHFVHIRASRGSQYYVKDEISRAIVASGAGGWGGANRVIFGLYGRQYKLYVKAPGAVSGRIDND